MPNIYNIDPHLPFAENFAAGLLNRYRNHLQDVVVYLPTTRSIQAVNDAFVKLTHGKALLLPCMYALGDTPQDEIDLAPNHNGDDGDDENNGENNFANGIPPITDIPPPIDKQARLFLLARLVQKFPTAEGKLSAANVLALARSLGNFLDTMQISKVPLATLEELCPEDYAAHWQKILRFLFILKDHWPAILAERGKSDIVEYQNHKLKQLAEHLQAEAPSDKRQAVIIAGSTGSRAAVRELASLVASLPHGAVVLPGVDTLCNDEEWSACGQDSCHPQYSLHNFLRALKGERNELPAWHAEPKTTEPKTYHERSRFLSWLMRSGDAYEESEALPHYGGDLDLALRGVLRYDCDTEAEEARLIAYHMRRTLETPHATAALITPSRALSVKVATELKRWHIDVDVSAGELLSLSPVGQYLKLIAENCSSLRPIKLLGLLRHPLSACAMRRAEFVRLTRLLERYVLRGSKPDQAFAGLRKKLYEKMHDKRLAPTEAEAKEIANFIDLLEQALSPLIVLQDRKNCNFGDILRAHITAAENFCKSKDENNQLIPGAERLWRGEDGIRTAKLLEKTAQAGDDFIEISFTDYAAAFNELLSSESFAEPYNRHPRLSVWGTLEARLQSADTLILAGLDETIWPQALPPDAWMSPLMRKRCGLPSAELKISLGAHDFCQALASGRQVILTRSQKRDGSPMVAARWLERLAAAQNQKTQELIEKGAPEKQHIKKLLNSTNPGTDKFQRPQANPPQQARPTKLSVTQFRMWRQDPYTIYAKHILKLNPLDPLEAPQDAAEKGTLIHKILERYVKEEQQGENAFQNIAEQELNRIALSLSELKIIQHKLNAIRTWFIATETHRQDIAKIITECQGQIAIPNSHWQITAHADRIDITQTGECHIIDYKSGTPPSKNDIISAKDPQLPLEAWMASLGAFTGEKNIAKSIQIWKVSGQFTPFALPDKQGGEIKLDIRDPKLQEAIENAKKLVHNLMALFAEKDMSYPAFPDADFPPTKQYNDYAYLERIDEWHSPQ